jgi:hypothetical protein
MESRVKEIFTENNSDSLMVIRERYQDGQEMKNYVPFAAWTDTKAFEQAAKKIFRLVF